MPNDMTQVKFTIDHEIVSAFKSRCAERGVSMTSVIRRWMADGSHAGESKNKTRVDTRPHRRKAVLEHIASLNELLDMETNYRDNIPEQFTQRYESADRACEQLAEAIACLEDAY